MDLLSHQKGDILFSNCQTIENQYLVMEPLIVTCQRGSSRDTQTCMPSICISVKNMLLTIPTLTNLQESCFVHIKEVLYDKHHRITHFQVSWRRYFIYIDDREDI